MSFISQGMAMKKIATHLKMPISTVRAFRTVTNLSGRGPMFVLPTHSEEDENRQKKIPKGSLLENYREK